MHQTGDLRQLAEDDDAVPFGTFLVFAGVAVLPGFIGGHGHVDHRAAAGRVLDFRVPAQGADDDCLVDASCHDSPLPTGPYLSELKSQKSTRWSGTIRADFVY